MNNRFIKQFAVCCLVVWQLLCAIPVYGLARSEQTVMFSSFEELEKLCAESSLDSEIAVLCTAEDLIFPEDFEIPSGMKITLSNFTVPEGITLTVMEQAEIQTYALSVAGILNNFGTVIQQNLSAEWAEEDIEISASVPGHIENKGILVLTDVFGRRNINRFGGSLTINETEFYQDKLKKAAGIDTLTPTMEVQITPTPAPRESDTGKITKTFDWLEVVLPKVVFALVLVLLIWIMKAKKPSSERKGKKKMGRLSSNASGSVKNMRSTADTGDFSISSYAYTDEDHFQRDKRNRIDQLDEWLKSGLIDRKEYNELKKRYM